MTLGKRDAGSMDAVIASAGMDRGASIISLMTLLEAMPVQLRRLASRSCDRTEPIEWT